MKKFINAQETITDEELVGSATCLKSTGTSS